MANGDIISKLTLKLTKRTDEFGELSINFNNSVDSIKKIFSEIQFYSISNQKSTEKLSLNIQEANDSIKEINQIYPMLTMKFPNNKRV